MLDFLSSPVLFPSDMDSPKLSAGATFKLPETMNWADYDDYNTMMDKSMANLTDLTKLEPVHEKNMHVYAPLFLDNDANEFNNKASYEKTTAIGGFDDDNSKRMVLLVLAQSMVQSYSHSFYSTPMKNDDRTCGDDDERKLLRANLRGALDVVEHDMQQNGYDSLYSSKKQQINPSYLSRGEQQWSWREEIIDVPDLVHSVCSSPSIHSFVIDSHPSTPVLLESDISSYMENDDSNQQQMDEMVTATLSIQHSQEIGKKNSQPLKKWMKKVKQATSTAKQDCAKSISNTSRKLCQWIKN